MIEEKIKEFYDKYFYFSYSSLNKLLYSPILFFDWYVLNQREDRTDKHLIEGKVLHCLLLQKDKFDDNFIIAPNTVPTGNNKAIIESIYGQWLNDNRSSKLKDFSDEIIEWLKYNDLHQKLSSDEKRVEKILIDKNLVYFEHLIKASGNKDIIDQEMLERCEESVKAVKGSQRAVELLRLGDSSFELVEVFNEIPLKRKLANRNFGIQGIIDNFVIDHSQNKLYINDLKTTQKSISDFPDSIEYFKYWLQASVYNILCKGYLKKIQKENYKIIFNFIVVDKYKQVYCFEVSKSTMRDWEIKTAEVLKKAEYHYKEKEYKLPYEFAHGDVVL